MQISTPLRRILHDEGRKQSWLAERAGTDKATMSRIVNGMHCDDGTQLKIANALRRDVCEVFPASLQEGEAA